MGSEAPPLYVLTLDPWRDTPGALPGMLSGWKLDRDPAVRALSGSVDDVTAALAALQVPGERDPSSGEITHPALVYIIDAQGRIAYMLNNPPVEWIIEAVRRARRTEA
jgi:cytochrome oxidase Cu insertion factor (SCO1/SenC/PrrC family)